MVTNGMRILKDVPLKLYSTMRLGGTADFLTEIKSKNDLLEAVAWTEAREIPMRVIGTGSNIIWRDEGFKGLLVINKIRGFEKVTSDHLTETYRIGAGEDWDTIVEQTAGLKLSGIECLSLIPGTAGATPVQNVGAYGQDISQTLVSLEAYDRMEKAFVTVQNAECGFGYRTSRFKSVDNGRFVIVSIDLKLGRMPLARLSKSVEAYLDEKEIEKRDPMTIRRAVIAIRRAKLPDPAKVANNGSFFANPIINNKTLKKLRKKYPDMPAWEVGPDHQKLAAAWLIETAGFKNKRDPSTGMNTWKNHALVVVNEKAKSTQNLLDYQDKIMAKVHELFDIELEREPELLP